MPDLLLTRCRMWTHQYLQYRKNLEISGLIQNSSKEEMRISLALFLNWWQKFYKTWYKIMLWIILTQGEFCIVYHWNWKYPQFSVTCCIKILFKYRSTCNIRDWTFSPLRICWVRADPRLCATLNQSLLIATMSCPAVLEQLSCQPCKNLKPHPTYGVKWGEYSLRVGHLLFISSGNAK